MKRLKGLPPLFKKNPTILILGTFPGCESILQEQYYAHGTNSFWKLLFNVFEKPFSKPNYQERNDLVIENGLAVWDVLESCFREGSSDNKIIDPIPNDIPKFLQQNPSVRTIIITSVKTEQYLFHYFTQLKSFNHLRILSSSSGTKGYSFEEKLKDWKQITDFL
jgi:hypoxanthine-DNA glycosylase